MGTKILSVLAAVSLTAVFGIAAGAEGDNVAKIGEQEYSTLQDAINAATGDTEIDLMSNTAEDVSIPSGKTVTIDLSGYKITNSTGHTITNNGTLTINDSSSSHAGTIDNVTHQKAAVYNESGATAMLNAGTYERSLEAGDTNGNNGNSYYTIYNQGNMEISDAVINNKGTYSSCIINGGYADNASLTITDTAVTGGVITVKNDEYGSELLINSGTFTNSAPNGVVVQNSGTAEITAGTFIGSGKYVIYATKGRANMAAQEETNSTTTISGGTFTATENAEIICSSDIEYNFKDNINISGGKFSDSFSTYFLSTNNVIVKENDSYVVKTDDNSYAARYAGVRYNSINEAIADCPTVDTNSMAQTVYVCKDTSENVVIPKDKRIQLDLSGYKITNDISSDQLCHTITNNGSLIIRDTSAEKNGTIDNVSHQKAAIYNEAGATATLNAGTYTRSAENGNSDNSGGNSYYYIVNHGTMTLNDISVKSNGSFSSLIENGWYNGNVDHPEGAVATMTINGGTFSGGINTVKNDDWGILTINDGRFENMTQHSVLNWNVAEINGGTFIAPDGYCSAANGYINDTMDKGQLTITDGDFTGGIYIVDAASGSNPDKAKEGVAVSGGTFSSDVSEYLADGCAISTGNNTYVVLNPDNNTGSVNDVGTYKSAANEDGSYDQLQILDTPQITSGEVGFKITDNKTTVIKTFKYANINANTKIGLIITDIPEDQTVSVSIAE